MYACDLHIKRIILFCIPLQEPMFIPLGTISLLIRMHGTESLRSPAGVLGRQALPPGGIWKSVWVLLSASSRAEHSNIHILVNPLSGISLVHYS